MAFVPTVKQAHVSSLGTHLGVALVCEVLRFLDLGKN